MRIKQLKEISMLSTRPMKSVSGVYRVMSVRRLSENLQSGGRTLLLSDSTGTLEVFLRPGEVQPWFPPAAPFRMRIMLGQQEKRLWVDPDSIEPAESFQSVLLIPPVWAARDECLPRLVSLYDALHSSAVRLFWDEVFRNVVWLRSFLTAPASQVCHHAFRGGLSVHSVQVAEQVQDVLRRVDHLRPLERDGAVTVALLHDASKVPVDGLTRPWRIPFSRSEHARLLPYLLSQPLDYLKRCDADAWGVLVRILDDYTRPRERANSPLADIVRKVDQLNAHLDARYLSHCAAGNGKNWLQCCGRNTWVPTREVSSAQRG